MAILRGKAWSRDQRQHLWRSSQSSSESFPGSMTIIMKLATHSNGFQNCCGPDMCFPFCSFVKGSICVSYSLLSQQCVGCIWWQQFVSLVNSLQVDSNHTWGAKPRETQHNCTWTWLRPQYLGAWAWWYNGTTVLECWENEWVRHEFWWPMGRLW